MLYSATNGNIRIGSFDMDYISFGKGDKCLVIIPGLGDGLKTVKGMAAVIAIMYRLFASEYKVYVFSRRNPLEKNFSTRDMATDCKIAMDKLGISLADVIGISQGGMIAQYIAIDYPELVSKLVLAVTLSQQNNTVQKVVSSWLEMAKLGDYKSIFIDTTEKSYTQRRLKKYRPFYPLLGRIGKPKDFSRFIVQANACVTHNSYTELDKIKTPTLVVGVDDDKVVGINSSEEMAQKIENSKLVIYKGFGHGVCNEAKDFNRKVLEFLLS
jgi:pimeloyl-ACP methyl ester carboxylesterase